MTDDDKTWRVWMKDEFDENPDSRDEDAMELRRDRSAWSITRIGRVLHCPYSIDDAEEAAEFYADYFHSERDGWECSWPVEFVVCDGDAYFVVSVDRDYNPTFSAAKSKPLVVSP
jgi:hypothetical protein